VVFESGLGVEDEARAFTEDGCLHGAFGIVGDGDGKDASGVVGILIISSWTWVSGRSADLQLALRARFGRNLEEKLQLRDSRQSMRKV